MARYKKLERINNGAQAVIHKGLNVDTGEEVALKYFTISGSKKPDPGEVQEQRARFLREVEAQSRLSHPNIVPILDFSSRGQRPWYAMPMAQGSLQDYLDQGRNDTSWRLDVVHRIIDAMEYAHLNHVVHRDLKPNNILVVDGIWMVSDFGFCRNLDSESLRMTQAGKLVGTLSYAAPEQYDDAHEAQPTADIYSIGKILIHCLTGSAPPPGGNRWSELPEEYKPIIVHCVAEEPSDRFQNLGDLRDSLTTVKDQSEEG